METVEPPGMRSEDDPPVDLAHDRGPAHDRDGPHDKDIALGRSLIFSALSLGFSPPTGTTLLWMAEEQAAWPIAAAAALLDLETGGGLASRVRALAGYFTGEAAIDHLSRSYARLFGHTARGAVSAYETEYGDDTLFQKPQELSDIAGFLRAFGLALDPRTRERIDHVSCEMEFMAFLARKEAYAVEIDDEPMRSETRRTSGLFLKDHLGRVVPSFAQNVLKEDPHGFYGALAALCLEFVESDCARFGAPIGPNMLRLRQVVEDRAPIACGTGPCPAFPGDEEERP